MTKLKTTLDEWAEKLSKKASEKDTSLQESTDAFKAVAAYYAALNKGKPKKASDDEDPTDGFSFGGGASEVINGGSKIPGRRDA